MPTRYASTPATALRSEHAEGPCWDARLNRLLWVDQFDGLVHLADYDSAAAHLDVVATYRLGYAVGAVVPTRQPDGGWLAACALGFAHLAGDGTVTMLAQPEMPTARMNDGKCDQLGRFWAGSMAWEKTPGAGSLYRLNLDLTLAVPLTGVTISNGLAWSADGTAMYYIDTPTRRVDRFTVGADGELCDRTTAVALAEGIGDPDGMCIDDEGCLWVALWGGHAVHRYSPVGELLAVADVDAPQVSSCCLGGPDRTTLFITTSQENMSAADRSRHAQSGKIFCAQVETPGRPAAAFGS